jgi:hypothetical protein
MKCGPAARPELHRVVEQKKPGQSKPSVNTCVVHTADISIIDTLVSMASGGSRGVPHAWAFVGDTPGRLLITFAPANKMEAFFRDNAKRNEHGEYLNDAEVYRAYGLELLGPPLSVG